jgi:hypothetical protein
MVYACRFSGEIHATNPTTATQHDLSQPNRQMIAPDPALVPQVVGRGGEGLPKDPVMRVSAGDGVWPLDSWFDSLVHKNGGTQLFAQHSVRRIICVTRKPPPPHPTPTPPPRRAGTPSSHQSRASPGCLVTWR